MISLTTLLAYVLPIVAAVGVGGLVLIYLGIMPASAALMLIVTRVIEKILSCKPCLYVIAVVSLCVVSWWLGHHQAMVACRAANEQAAQAARNADLDAAHKAVAEETTLVNTIEDDDNARKAKDAAYIAKLKADPACGLTAADISGLRYHKRRHFPHLTPRTK